jgi:hypothetical protein
LADDARKHLDAQLGVPTCQQPQISWDSLSGQSFTGRVPLLLA